MHELDRPIGEPALTGEVLDNQGYIQAVFTKLGIEDELETYLGGESKDQDVSILLMGYSERLAEVAVSPDGVVDIEIVRFGVEHLTGSMNTVCSRKFGFEQPKTLSDAMKVKLGMLDPVNRSYVRALDDRYWTKQFPEELVEETLARRQPHDNAQQYLAKHIQASIHGYIFAPFSFMQG